MIRGTRVLAASVSLLCLLGSGFAWVTYRTFTTNITHVDAIAPPGHHDLDGPAQNVLLIGDDHRPPGASQAELNLLHTQQDGGGINTDTMMVLHVPANGSKATIVSFPRDSWVNVPGFGMNKLNAAYQLGSQNGRGDAGGARLLIRVIETMTGLRIDHFVRVSLLGFYDIAKALGPITVCLNRATHDSYSGISLPAGKSTLDAQQALAFVRQRHGLPRGDLDREVRQQYFLATEFRQVVSAGTLLNPFRLQNMLKAVSSALEADPGLNLLSFARQFENLSAGKVTFATIPILGTPTISVAGNDVSIVAVDQAAMAAFITQVIGEPAAYTRATPALAANVTVQVLNGGAAPGAAAAATATLTHYGFHTRTPASTTTTGSTAVEYPPGMEAQAKALAGKVPGAIALATTAVTQITLVLGTDGHHVTPVPVAGASNPTRTPAPVANATAATPGRAFTQTDCIN